MKEASWKVDTPKLLLLCYEENPKGSVLRIPLNIFQGLLGRVAKRALELNDEELNAYMCALALYEESNPSSKEYNPKLVNKLIKKYLEKTNQP